jgi:hypothetical protein
MAFARLTSTRRHQSGNGSPSQTPASSQTAAATAAGTSGVSISIRGCGPQIRRRDGGMDFAVPMGSKSSFSSGETAAAALAGCGQ